MLVVLVGALIAQHYIAGLPMTAISSLMPLARLGDICLVGLVLLLGQALGCWVLRQARICVDEAERVAYTTALGLGILAYIGLALGLVGLYRPPVLLLVLMLLALMVRHELWVAVTRLRARFTNIGRVARTTSWSLSLALLVAIMALSWAGVLLGALTPPHHFDPLAYHLAAPQRFLHTGQIAPAPDVLFGNLPLTVELLYGIGLAFGSAAFGQLLHLAFAGLTGLALWALARRYYGRATAWLALALFLTTPLVAVWARVADIDLALSCFLLLATMATLRAGEAVTVAIAWRWALLAGVFGGLALGAKYQAWFAVPLLGLMLVIERARSKPRDARAALGTLAAFGGAALAVAAPWYIKNWLVLGNPLWPLFWGGRDYSRQAVALTDYFASGMTISPRTLTGYLLLPLRTYTVGDIEQRLVILNPLFLLAPLVVFCRGKARRPLVYCGVLSAGLALGWAGGFQELRYLLPICAPLSLATAVVLRAALDRVRWQWAVRPALLGASVIALGLVILHVGADRPAQVLLGRESVDGYWRQSITTGATYRAT
ncbi:MAG: ArnT family glycosyltransferase, partial [Thermomicrobiales bacterium]